MIPSDQVGDCVSWLPPCQDYVRPEAKVVVAWRCVVEYSANSRRLPANGGAKAISDCRFQIADWNPVNQNAPRSALLGCDGADLDGVAEKVAGDVGSLACEVGEVVLVAVQFVHPIAGDQGKVRSIMDAGASAFRGSFVGAHVVAGAATVVGDHS